LKQTKNEFEIPGKGRNETLEIVDMLEDERCVTAVSGSHVPENGGARDLRFTERTCQNNYSEHDA
jgi:hypothetical protein